MYSKLVKYSMTLDTSLVNSVLCSTRPYPFILYTRQGVLSLMSGDVRTIFESSPVSYCSM